jgi:inner membrane protein
VEPVTHALTSLAIARAAQKRLPRFGTAMIVISGIAADLDFVSYLRGPGTFMRFHRTMLHSLLGSAVMVCAIAWLFTLADKKFERKPGGSNPPSALRLGPAVIACATGAAGHLLLDLASGIGVQLLWPFHSEWFSLDVLANVDLWVLLLLIVGLLLPPLFALVGDEIGDHKKKTTGVAGAVVTLLILLAYVGARGVLHGQATALLLSREYHGREPLSGATFPYSTTPFEWRGVVVTDNTIELADVPLAPGTEFDPDRDVTRYKPDDSQALEKTQATPIAERFLKYARFPLASTSRVEDGYRVEIHDLRFASDENNLDDIYVRVDLDSSLRITRQEFRNASSPN